MTKRPSPKKLRMLPGGQLAVPTLPLTPTVEELPLASWMATTAWVEALSDAALADLLAQHLLPMMQVWAWPHTLLSEAIDRLGASSRAEPGGPC